MNVLKNDLKISEAKTKRKNVASHINRQMDKIDLHLEKMRDLLSMEHNDRKNIFYHHTVDII